MLNLTAEEQYGKKIKKPGPAKTVKFSHFDKHSLKKALSLDKKSVNGVVLPVSDSPPKDSGIPLINLDDFMVGGTIAEYVTLPYSASERVKYNNEN